MKEILLALIFSSALYAQPAIKTPQDISIYDENNDGFAQFDLTTNSTTLLDGLNPDEHRVSYHLTFKDADLNTNAISKPTCYINTIPQVQELYARVTNIAVPLNYSVDLFSIRVYASSKSFLEAQLKL